jgi:transcriptional regulator with XRE-family HTH domain
MELSKKIKSIRKLRNFTQETVAEKLGISTYSYAKIERGETDVKYSRLQQIAKIMEIELEDLFSMHDKKVFNLIGETNNIQLQSYAAESNSIGDIESKRQLEKANLIIEQRDKEINSLKQEINTLKQYVNDLRDMINILKPGKY